MQSPVFTVAICYRDPQAALDWLERAFGFEITMAIDGPDDAPQMCHYEMSMAGRGRIMIGAEWADWTRSPASLEGVNTQTTHVEITGDLDAHCQQARAGGAVIVAEPADQFYGDRKYRAIDHEGHRWTFTKHVRDVTRAEAEEAIGQKIVATNWP